ncbi:MAG: hypothetical protein IJ908_01805 [Fibrobacter sp.]|nr:hypothetical protein [Fibrobacter sp.]
MNAREFFYLVSNMRSAQNQYFATREQKYLRACKRLESEVDAEIQRVKDIINEQEIA